MRITLVYPNIGCQIGFNYGLAHISAVLKAAGHEVHLVNVCEKLDAEVSPDRVALRIAQSRPDVVGLSIVTNQFPYACKLARALRTRCAAPIVCGGSHATMAPEETISTRCFDFVCVGEGEYAMLDLVEALERGADTTSIRNIWTLEDGAIKINPVRPFCDLTALPSRDYELFDFQQMIDAKQGWVGLMATRGCPFRCTYCLNHAVVERYRRESGCRASDYIRCQPVSDLLSEIGRLLSRYTGITTFIFDDDVFTLDTGWLSEFCDGYRRSYDMPFVCNSHVKLFDDERAVMLKQAGCWMVKFGLESGSERIRTRVLGRRMTNREIEDAFATAHRHGLQTSAFVMMGLPDETAGDLHETIDLLASIGPSRFRWTIYFPMPGTRLFDLCVERGLIDERRMVEQTNFMDDTCLRLSDEMTLLVRRLRWSLPWFVNAQSPGEVGRRFSALARDLRVASDGRLAELRTEGERLCREMASQSLPHYCTKYNPFTAVRTDTPGI